MEELPAMVFRKVRVCCSHVPIHRFLVGGHHPRYFLYFLDGCSEDDTVPGNLLFFLDAKYPFPPDATLRCYLPLPCFSDVIGKECSELSTECTAPTCADRGTQQYKSYPSQNHDQGFGVGSIELCMSASLSPSHISLSTTLLPPPCLPSCLQAGAWTRHARGWGP